MKHFARNHKLEAAFIRVYREDARREQHGMCAYCREPITYRTTTADHVIPRKAHGLDGRNNIVAACLPCNQAKGHLPAERFKRLLQSFPSGQPAAILMAWSRRRLNIAIERMERNINSAMGRGA